MMDDIGGYCRKQRTSTA